MIPRDEIVVVSGLPRSGTSLMMAMLGAGGLPLVTDGVRGPDAHNPRGYFEDQRVRRLEQDGSWLGEARGRALKVVSLLLPALPADHAYRVILMEREMAQILASQREMMEGLGTVDPTPDPQVASLFARHLEHTRAWLDARRIPTLRVPFRQALTDPWVTAGDVSRFLGGGLDVEAMVGVVDPSLWRQKVSGT